MLVINFGTLKTFQNITARMVHLNTFLLQAFAFTKCEVCSMVLCVADFVIKSIVKCEFVCHLFLIVYLFTFCVLVCIPIGCVEHSFCQIPCTAFSYLQVVILGTKLLCVST